MRTILLATVLAAFSFVTVRAETIQVGQIRLIPFFCTSPEPYLDAMAVDKPGGQDAVDARFEQAFADGECVSLSTVISARAVRFLVEAETASSGMVEIWEMELPGAPSPVYFGFRSAMVNNGNVAS